MNEYTINTMSLINALSYKVGISTWEFYNSLASSYPSLEMDRQVCFSKVVEGQKVEYTFECDMDLDMDTPEYQPKTSTKRYDVRDKAKHGRKGKKINDINGKHWTRVYMTNPKKEKAMKRQNIQDIQDMEFSQMCSSHDIGRFTRWFYRMVDKPATKTYHEVLMEVFDKFDFMLTDTSDWNIIEDVVKEEYEKTQWKVATATMKLEDALWDLESAEKRVDYYQDMLDSLLG